MCVYVFHTNLNNYVLDRNTDLCIETLSYGIKTHFSPERENPEQHKLWVVTIHAGIKHKYTRYIQRYYKHVVSTLGIYGDVTNM